MTHLQPSERFGNGAVQGNVKLLQLIATLMSSASRHICRHLVRTIARPISQQTSRTRIRQPIQSQNVRQLSSTRFLRADPDLQPSRTLNEDVDPFDGDEPLVPSIPMSKEDLDPEERTYYDTLAPKQQAQYMVIQNHFKATAEDDLDDQPGLEDDEMRSINFEALRGQTAEVVRLDEMKDALAISQGFWQDEEDEMTQVEDGDNEITDDMITSVAESELEVHREVREYTRIAAWDLPLLLGRSLHMPPIKLN